MLAELRPEAEKRIKTKLVMEAIVKAENLETSEERLQEELQKMADAYEMEEYEENIKRFSRASFSLLSVLQYGLTEMKDSLQIT